MQEASIDPLYPSPGWVPAQVRHLIEHGNAKRPIDRSGVCSDRGTRNHLVDRFCGECGVRLFR